MANKVIITETIYGEMVQNEIGKEDNKMLINIIAAGPVNNAKIRVYSYMFRDKCYNCYSGTRLEQKSTKKKPMLFIFSILTH